MKLEDMKRGCINKDEPKITEEMLEGMIRIMPNSVNSLDMAKVFYTLLECYGMDNPKKASDVFAVVIGVIGVRDREMAKRDKEKSNAN